MEKKVNVRAEAIKEISKEKARIFRKKTEGLSLLEQIALAWKEKKKAEERQSQELLKKGESFRITFPETLADYDKQRLSFPERIDEIGWAQYNPWQKKGDKKKKVLLNMATVVAIRKKLVALEWARALGKRTQDTKFWDLERQAVLWKQKKEEEGKRREELRIRIQRSKKLLSESLMGFGRRLKEKKETPGPQELLVFLEESLEDCGEVFNIEWKENRCLIWIEPWEERKIRRRFLGFDIPVIYRGEIDDDLNITSYEKVEDEEIIERLRKDLLSKPLKRSLENISFNIDTEKEAKQFLEDELLKLGRLLNLEPTQNGWLATIEPWEEMRIRNIKREGKPPIITNEIEIDWKDGKLEFVPGELEEDSEEEEVVEVEENKTLEGGKDDERD